MTLSTHTIIAPFAVVVKGRSPYACHVMIDIDHLRLLKAVAHAAHAYREAMRHYIREQTGLLDEGMPIEGLTDRIAGGFAELAEAEDALDDALVVLEWYASTAHSE